MPLLSTGIYLTEEPLPFPKCKSAVKTQRIRPEQLTRWCRASAGTKSAARDQHRLTVGACRATADIIPRRFALRDFESLLQLIPVLCVRMRFHRLQKYVDRFISQLTV